MDAMQLLSQTNIDLTFSSTADKQYDRLLQYSNVTSYSQLTLLHSCPRKFQLTKHRATTPEYRQLISPNLDFCFGHAVGAGAQNFLLTRDLAKAQLNGSLAWRAGFEDRKDKGKKSLWEAMIAIEKFAAWEALEDYELLKLPSGKPAIELSFSLHARDGFKHYGHMDIGLVHIHSGRITVLELKTEGALEPEDAKYANSNQATGYSVMLSAVYPSLTEYDVLYAVYSTLAREWSLIPYKKTILHRAETVKDLMLDQSTIATYEDIGYYPKRGESCYNFRRRCEFFGECDLVPGEKLPVLGTHAEAEEPDFVISLDSVIEELKKHSNRDEDEYETI